MKYRLLKRQLHAIIKNARLAADKNGHEICGLLVSNGYVLEVVELKNRVKSGGGFAFYATEIRAVERAMKLINHEIVGTFHSHPAYFSEPGESDILHAVDDSIMLIIDVMGNDVGLWHIKDNSKRRLSYELI